MPLSNIFVKENCLMGINGQLNELYYDNVNWMMPFGNETVIIDGILNSNGWNEWSDARVEIICFNFSAMYTLGNYYNFAAFLYLKHNFTHKLFALDLNWTPSLTLNDSIPLSYAGQRITALYDNITGHKSGNSTWNDKGKGLTPYPCLPDQFLIYFDEMYNGQLDNLDETCVRANDSGPNDGYFTNIGAEAWAEDQYGSNVSHARGLHVFEVAVPMGSHLDTEDLDKDDIATRGQDVQIGVLFGYGRYINYEVYQPFFDKGEPENTFGNFEGVSQSDRWDSDHDGDVWPDSSCTIQYVLFDRMVQTPDFYNKPLDGSRISLIPGVPNPIAGRTSGGWLATTLNITPTGPANFSMNASEDPPQGIPPVSDVASLYLNFTFEGTLAEPAIVRIYFNVSDGEVGTRGIFAVSQMAPTYYNETLGQWVEITPYTINSIEGYVEFYLDHFSFYAIVGKETQQENPPAPPIPGFEILFMIFSICSLILLYSIYKGHKIRGIRVQSFNQ